MSTETQKEREREREREHEVSLPGAAPAAAGSGMMHGATGQRSTPTVPSFVRSFQLDARNVQLILTTGAVGRSVGRRGRSSKTFASLLPAAAAANQLPPLPRLVMSSMSAPVSNVFVKFDRYVGRKARAAVAGEGEREGGRRREHSFTFRLPRSQPADLPVQNQPANQPASQPGRVLSGHRNLAHLPGQARVPRSPFSAAAVGA